MTHWDKPTAGTYGPGFKWGKSAERPQQQPGGSAMNDYSELRAITQAANDAPFDAPDGEEGWRAHDGWYQVTPAEVLALLDEVERLRAALEMAERELGTHKINDTGLCPMCSHDQRLSRP